MASGGSARRSRSTASIVGAGRSAALEQLRALREQGGRRVDAFEVKLDDKIYDTVTEDDYADLVARRRADLKDFVVDDSGLGYGDDGEEDDWGNGAVSSCEDDDDGGTKKKRKKSDAESKKKDGAPKVSRKTSSLAAAAALMGKQKVSSMFASALSLRKGNVGGARDDKKGLGFSADSILEDLLAEITPDEADKEKRRRQRPAVLKPGPADVETPLSNGNQHCSFAARSFTRQLEGSTPSETKQEASDTVLCNDSLLDLPVEIPNDVEPQHLASENKTVEEINRELEKNKEESQPAVPLVPSLEGLIPEQTQKSESSVQEKGNHVLNAKILSCSDSGKATDDWQAVWRDRDAIAPKVEEEGDSKKAEEDLPLEADGNLMFYLIDAYEEAFGANAGTVYLFGKVKSNNVYTSCCLVVQNMQRCVYAIPDPMVFPDNTISELEQAVKAGSVEHATIRKKLQEMAKGLKEELSQKLLKLNVTSFSMVPVKRNYAFERTDVPTGENYVIKLGYAFKDLPLPSDLKGKHFLALFGTHSSALEMLLIKRKIRGPTWLSISKATCCPSSSKVSWCKFEALVGSPKDIKVVSAGNAPPEIPSVLVAAINLKTVVNEKSNVNEIVSVSVVFCRKTKIDIPMPRSEWSKAGILGHFSIVRKPEGGIFPMGFTKDAQNRNSTSGSTVLNCESSERALLNLFFNKLHQLDPDVLVGHNISGFDLDVLLHRAQACKVPSNMWSKIGRLKRSLMPKLSKGSNNFGTGASLGVTSCIAGRLLCDTYMSARELLKEVSYSLTQLAKNQLGRDRKEIAPVDIPNMYRTSSSLLELVDCAETDAWLSLGLMFHLSILPLTRQLTNISGNLWSKTLMGARAQRVEYFLLHEFHTRKYILPDKLTIRERENMSSKRKLGEEEKELVNDEATHEDDIDPVNVKSKKGPSYSGGLVLEPKKGLYDKYILLLDFNSLYPSIIQEYNICFTTVERPSNGSIPNLPNCNSVGVLPQLLKNLVGRRRQVKTWLKNTSDPLKCQQLDIQQQALKLTANSMYGCLGFANSRFYAKPLAELITSQGREILQSTVDLVQNNLNLQVIYGDTDSIMIHSGLDDVSDAKMVAMKVIKEVNKKYKCLEIDLDGVYKRMLLLKKKKYAAVKVQTNKDGSSFDIIEQKGLDIVRRDWSLLSKEIGNFCLEQILSGGTCEDVVEAIHLKLQKIQEEMRNGQVELEKYVITKTLTRSPEEYPDARSQPHVQVALRMKQNGHRIGCSVGDTVPYIICSYQGVEEIATSTLAERARHPDELKRDNSNWMVDIDYYLSQQIHPVVTRLCAPIQGTSPARLADCLGLDSAKFDSRTNMDNITKDVASVFFSTLDSDERYQDCEPFMLKCPHCPARFQCPSASEMINNWEKVSSEKKKISETPPKASAGATETHKPLYCPKCQENDISTVIPPPMLANQLQMFACSFIEKYYAGLMICDDEMCKYTTRKLNLRVMGDSERGTICPNYPRCNGHLIPQYSEVDVYKQLTYLCRLFDMSRVFDKMDANPKKQADILKCIGWAVENAATIVRKLRDRCGYGWIKVDELVIS